MVSPNGIADRPNLSDIVLNKHFWLINNRRLGDLPNWGMQQNMVINRPKNL